MKNVEVGKNVTVSPYTNIYDCVLNDDVFIGPFVEIQRGVVIGKSTRISSHSFVCEGVSIGQNCFIAHGVMFTNDKFTEDKEKWILRTTTVGDNVRIGSNSTILPIKIGNNVVIGAGSVVTNDVPDNSIVFGNPAKIFSKK
jgi:acetyltransferase-like isoleucine patch superfamily enzyme